MLPFSKVIKSNKAGENQTKHWKAFRVICIEGEQRSARNCWECCVQNVMNKWLRDAPVFHDLWWLVMLWKVLAKTLETSLVAINYKMHTQFQRHPTQSVFSRRFFLSGVFFRASKLLVRMRKHLAGLIFLTITNQRMQFLLLVKISKAYKYALVM